MERMTMMKVRDDSASECSCRLFYNIGADDLEQ